MNSNLPQKGWSNEKEVEDRHPRKRDPRTHDSQDEETATHRDDDKDELTDLDVAYSILFEDANNEYIKEKEQKKESRQKGKAAIPQRVFSSFLASIENDVMEYSSNVVHHGQLIKEEGRLKSEIDSVRKDVVTAKQQRSTAQRAVFELQEKRNRITREVDVLQTASAVMEKAKKLLHRRGVTFSIPSSAVLEQVDSYKMLEALNESVQEKLDQLTKCTNAQYHCAICTFQQFGSVFCKKRREETKKEPTEERSEKTKEVTAPAEATNPDISLIIDVSDDEKEGVKRVRVAETEDTEEDSDQLFRPVGIENESDEEIVIKKVHI
ncbi:hypothetical protein BLSTO_00758 [Blastocystis sp. subtype 1]